MGYYTDYTLELHGHPDEIDRFNEADVRVPSYDRELIGEVLDRDSDDTFYAQEIKWYGHMDDMEIISTAWPNIFFTLTGYGENQGDIWVAYFKAGKSEKSKARIQLPPTTLK